MKKILVADDEPNIRELMKAALTLCQCEVVLAATGEEAHKLAISEQPDLIITDHLMPGFTGYDLLHKIRQHPKLKNVPVIMCTGKKFDDEFPELLKIENCSFVSKPFDINQLITSAEKALKLQPGDLR